MKNNECINKLHSPCEGVERYVLAVYKPALERRVVLMEEVMLCIVRFLIGIPHPLHGLPGVPQCSKKTESLFRTPIPHPLLLEPTSK